MTVRMDDIVVDFPGARALDHVSVAFHRGEVHGLVGENGAGKSTLANVLAGVRAPHSGTIAVGEGPVRFASPRDALAHGIALVSQEGSLVPSLTGAQNILLGHEPRLGPILRRRALRAEAERLFASWFPDQTIDLNRPVEALASADQKVIEIVRGLRANLRLLILDEPTATLMPRERRRLWHIIRQLPGRGVGVILISHFLSEVLALSHRVTVLRDGRRAGTYPAPELSEPGLVDVMVRRESARGHVAEAQPSHADRRAAPVLTVRGWRAGRIRVPAFDLAPGEIVGLIGLSGAGHVGFARSLYTGVGHIAGTLEVAGRPVRGGPRAKLSRGLAFVPDRRMENALVGEGTIGENLALVHARAACLPGTAIVLPGAARREAERVMTVLSVKANGPDQTVKTLSGGNKQKVSLGKWLYGAPAPYRAIIFVEPTEGVDVAAKDDIYRLMRDLAAAGTGIVIASSDLMEIERLCDRVVPFVAGQPGPDIPAAGFSEAVFIKAMAGDVVPGAAATVGAASRNV